MSYENNTSSSEQPAERRVWDAPQIITVVPVDRTEGGVNPAIAEGGALYKLS